MGTHVWLLPWGAILVCLIVLITGIGSAFAALRAAPPASLPLPFVAVWLIATALAVVASLGLGTMLGIDVIAARGALLGSLGGAVLIEIARRLRDSRWLPPLHYSLCTLIVAAARLWLTHGEITGLTSVALGMAVAVLCLALAPSLMRSDTDGAHAPILALVYVACLTAASELGFTKATDLDQAYWPDLPLLLGASLALGQTAAALMPAKTPRLVLSILPMGMGLLAAGLMVWQIEPDARLMTLPLLGCVAFGLLAFLTTDAGTSPTGSELGTLFGLAVCAAAVTVAFAAWSGYGLALVILGGWLALGGSIGLKRTALPMAVLGFAATVLIYRLALLQSGSAVRASGPGDIWDLFAIVFGALLPLLTAAWIQLDVAESRLPGWAVLLEWLVALIAPALILDYIWQPRSLAGVFLGVALGQLLAAARTGPDDRQRQTVVFTGVAASLVLFQFLPVLGQTDDPSRAIRVGLILALAVILLLRLLIPMALRRRAPVRQG